MGKQLITKKMLLPGAVFRSETDKRVHIRKSLTLALVCLLTYKKVKTASSVSEFIDLYLSVCLHEKVHEVQPAGADHQPHHH